MTEELPIIADAVEPSQTADLHEERAVHNPCPVCGFNPRRLDRFCRKYGINLEQWQNATRSSLYATSTITRSSLKARLRGTSRTWGQTGAGR